MCLRELVRQTQIQSINIGEGISVVFSSQITLNGFATLKAAAHIRECDALAAFLCLRRQFHATVSAHSCDRGIVQRRK